MNGGPADSVLVMSGSSDKTVKLWDLRNSSEPLDVVKLPQPVEDFCQLQNPFDFVVANGNMMNVIRLSDT